MAVDIEITSLVSDTAAINETDPDNIFWEGNGIFDKLIHAVNQNIKIQFDSGRIAGTDYASVYLGSLQSTLQTALQLEIEAKKMKLSKAPSGNS